MNWKLIFIGFVGLFWGTFLYAVLHTTILGTPSQHSQVKIEPAEVEAKDVVGYSVGESREDLLHQLRANGWRLRGEGMFYRSTVLSRYRAQCVVVTGSVNCHLRETPVLLFTINKDKVMGIEQNL